MMTDMSMKNLILRTQEQPTFLAWLPPGFSLSRPARDSGRRLLSDLFVYVHVYGMYISMCMWWLGHYVYKKSMGLVGEGKSRRLNPSPGLPANPLAQARALTSAEDVHPPGKSEVFCRFLYIAGRRGLANWPE